MTELKDIPMFSTLGEEHLKELQNAIHVRHYKKGSILFYEGDQSSCMYILLGGEVKLYKTSPKGSKLEINRLHAPSLVAEYACFEAEPFPESCEFLTEGTIGLLRFDNLANYLNQAAFSTELIRSLTSRTMSLFALIHKETILSSEAKVADFIIKQRSLFKRLKKNEIASILNLTPETFSRMLAKFKKEGIIVENHQTIKVLDEEALYMIVETNTMKGCTTYPIDVLAIGSKNYIFPPDA